MFRPARLSFACMLGLALVGCGGDGADSRPTQSAQSQESEAARTEPPPDQPPADEPELAAEPEPEPPPPEPEPVDVEAGARLGPVRIGMSEEEVRALGLEELEVDPRSRRFGPYRVFFDDGSVRRVEAQMGALERIRFGSQTFEVGTHIHALRDAFGGCEWREGGGERYRCADGTLWVYTTHSLAPARYTIAVERR